ncbi:MAG TPA: DUF4148 domain-containing protein [Albitalea sp.]|uniref:DUF4148 domain-containing protein n=1 Tax=Piscinibacter sp. TaxID=1903157 RepID=UPI002ED401A8
MQALSRTSRLTLQLVAGAAVALMGSVAMAGEATQFVDPPSTLTRAEVQAELAGATSRGDRGEATTFADQKAVTSRDREDVRSEARHAAREHKFNEHYVGA